MILNTNLNETSQKIMWEESVHTCEHVLYIMETTGINKIPLEIFYGEKLKIIDFFSEFGRIAYATKREKIKLQKKEKPYKAIMVGCTDNHKIYTHKLYNPENKRVIISDVIKWE